MAQISDEVLEDIGKLLTDCSKLFRKFEVAEKDKFNGSLSLVEHENATHDAQLYEQLGEACAKYAKLACGSSTAI